MQVVRGEEHKSGDLAIGDGGTRLSEVKQNVGHGLTNEFIFKKLNFRTTKSKQTWSRGLQRKYMYKHKETYRNTST